MKISQLIVASVLSTFVIGANADSSTASTSVIHTDNRPNVPITSPGEDVSNKKKPTVTQKQAGKLNENPQTGW